MGMFGEAAGSILRLPKVFGIRTPGDTMVRISAGQLDTVLNQAENVTLKARDLVAGRSQFDLTTSLESTSWSVAQCLDHLAQTANAFVPAISSAIARAPHLTTNRALRTGALTGLFIRNLEPPYRLRVKVLAPLVPRRHDFNSAWGAFEESQTQLAKTIRSAAGLAIDQVRVESPVYARFSYNVYGALRMLTAHEHRHLWHIEQILKALDGTRVRNAS
jgi:DinB superfamily